MIIFYIVRSLSFKVNRGSYIIEVADRAGFEPAVPAMGTPP